MTHARGTALDGDRASAGGGRSGSWPARGASVIHGSSREDGRLVGLLSAEAVAEFLNLQAALYHDDRVLRMFIVTDEVPPRFVEWVAR